MIHLRENRITQIPDLGPLKIYRNKTLIAKY